MFDDYFKHIYIHTCSIYTYIHVYNYNVCIYLVRRKFVQSEHSCAADGRLDEAEIHYASLRHAGLLHQFYARTKKLRAV